jgi:hypothetical protein
MAKARRPAVGQAQAAGGQADVSEIFYRIGKIIDLQKSWSVATANAPALRNKESPALRARGSKVGLM